MLAGELRDLLRTSILRNHQSLLSNLRRFITGLAIGIFCCVLPIYATEHSPRAIKGLLVSTFYLFEVVGSWLAFWISYGTRQHVSSTSDAQWIIPLAIQTHPVFIFAFSLYGLPDTPRSLVHRGKTDVAHMVLERTSGLDHEHSYVTNELARIQSQIHVNSRRMPSRKLAFKVLTSRRRLLIAIGLMIAQGMSGYYSVFYAAIIFFMRNGYSGFEIQMYTNVLNGALEIVSSIIFTLFMIDRLGRRRSLLWTIPVQAICLLAVGTLSAVADIVDWPAAKYVSYAVFGFAYLCDCFFRLGLGPVPVIYIAEISSTQLKAFTVGIAVAVQWLLLAGLSRALPYMLFYIGRSGNSTSQQEIETAWHADKSL